MAVERSGSADPRLIGYVAADATPAELIAFAASRLPGYMVPAAIVVLPALPMTPTARWTGPRCPRRTGWRPAWPRWSRRSARRPRARWPGSWPGCSGTCRSAPTTTSSPSAVPRCWSGGWRSQIAAELQATVSLADLLGARTVAAIAAMLDERTGRHRPRDRGPEPDAPRPAPPARRSARAAGTGRFRCRCSRSGCGSSSSCHRATWPTTSRPRCRCTARWTPTALRARARRDRAPARDPADRVRHGRRGRGCSGRSPAARAPLRVLDVPAEQAEEVIAARAAHSRST